MNKFLPIALLAIFVVGCKGGDTTAATGGGTGTSGGDKSVTLKLTPKQGEKYSYIMKTGDLTNPMEIGMTMTAEKVEGGKVTLVTTFDSMKMKGQEVPAQVMDMMKKMKVTSEMDETGKTLSTKMDGAPAGTPAPDSSSTSFPPNAIKVGDTWDGVSKMQGQEIKSKYKLTGIETVNGMEVAVLEQTLEGLPAGGAQDGPAVTKIEIATGMPVSMTMKMKVKGADGKETSATTEMMRK